MASYPQVIPRPDDWRPGRPAPWAELGDEERRGLSVERVVGALAAAGLAGPPGGLPVPGSDEIEVLDGISPRSDLRSSAVLLALFDVDGEAHVVLTRRSTRLRNHRGEVSFPGGRLDEGEDAVMAALREAHEEVALDPGSVEVVAHLTPIVTLASGSIIQPVVGILSERPSLEASPSEVERAFDVALSDLLVDGVFHEERWRRPGRPTRSPDGSFPLWFFEIAGEMIWGATGRLLVDVLCTTLGVRLEPLG